jgi:hypothetical protein
MARELDRRRTTRTELNSRAMLEMSLDTWRNVRTGWDAVLLRAKTLGNDEKIALAESKLDECETQIARIETVLNGPGAAS